MGLLFGKDELITCIQHVEVKGPRDESLCLAYKTTKLFIGAGVWISDDGYTLRIENDPKHFFKVNAEQIAGMQNEGLLPRPLPAYSIPWYEYAFGYSLWIVIALSLLFWRAGAMRRSRRLREDAATPTSFGPPLV